MSPVAEDALQLILGLSDPHHPGLPLPPPLHQLLPQLLPPSCIAPQLVQDEPVPLPRNQATGLQLVGGEAKQSRLEALATVDVPKQLTHKVFSFLHLEKTKSSQFLSGYIYSLLHVCAVDDRPYTKETSSKLSTDQQRSSELAQQQTWVLFETKTVLPRVQNEQHTFVIPDICHFLYTDKNFGQKILHRRTRNLRQTDFATK